MLRAFAYVFFAPWWVFLIIGALYYGAMTWAHSIEVTSYDNRLAALERPAPERVDLDKFVKETNVSDLNEVNVAGWIDSKFNYHLTKTKNGSVESERHVYMVFGPSDEASTTVRAAIVLTGAEKENFLAYWMGATDVERTTFGADDFPGRVISNLNGRASDSDSFDDMVENAIEQSGLQTADDFFYLSPYFNGRVAALTPTNTPDEFKANGTQQALWIVYWGLFRLAFGRIWSALRPKRKAPETDDTSVQAAETTKRSAKTPNNLQAEQSPQVATTAPRPTNNGRTDWVAAAAAKQQTLRQEHVESGRGGVSIDTPAERALKSPHRFKFLALTVLSVVGAGYIGFNPMLGFVPGGVYLIYLTKGQQASKTA